MSTSTNKYATVVFSGISNTLACWVLRVPITPIEMMRARPLRRPDTHGADCKVRAPLVALQPWRWRVLVGDKQPILYVLVNVTLTPPPTMLQQQP